MPARAISSVRHSVNHRPIDLGPDDPVNPGEGPCQTMKTEPDQIPSEAKRQIREIDRRLDELEAETEELLERRNEVVESFEIDYCGPL